VGFKGKPSHIRQYSSQTLSNCFCDEKKKLFAPPHTDISHMFHLTVIFKNKHVHIYVMLFFPTGKLANQSINCTLAQRASTFSQIPKVCFVVRD